MPTSTRLGGGEEVVHLGLDEERAHALLVVEWGLPFAQQLGGGGVALQLDVHDAGRGARLWPVDATATAAFSRCAQAIGRRSKP